jgi:hypothetical protein
MTTLQHIRILPPLAIARFGSAETPVEDYDFGAVDEGTQIRTLIFTASGHQVTHSDFKDRNKGVKPVAPFLELWGIFDNEPNKLQPLTPERLASAGLDIEEVIWKIEVANRKLFRRTDNPHDIIEPKNEKGEGKSLGVNHTDTTKQPINARANNFKQPDKTIFLGQIEALGSETGKPLRLRFTPGKGLVYQQESVENSELQPGREQVLMQGEWLNPGDRPRHPVPGQTSDAGRFDDSCDCLLTAQIGELRAHARISSAPPDFSPDTQPFRSAYDEFEQYLLGPAVKDYHYPPGAAGNAQILHDLLDLYQRVYDTVSLVNPRENAKRWYKEPEDANSLDHQDVRDTHKAYLNILRAYRGETQERTKLDQLSAILSLLKKRLRQTTDTGKARYHSPPNTADERNPSLPDSPKMPFLMRGSDSGFLVLTDRQRDKFNYAAKRFSDSLEYPDQTLAMREEVDPYISGLPLDDILKLLRFRPSGNPPSTSIESVVGNCFPGLDLDLRGILQRLLRDDNGEEKGLDRDYILHETLGALIAKPGSHDQGWNHFWPVTLKQSDGQTPVELDYWQYNDENAETRTDRFNRLCRFLWQDAKRKDNDRLDTQVEYHLEFGESSGSELVRLNELIDPDTGYITRGHAGELTHGLCSPWQKDYRDCNCVYWSSNAPDYVAKQNETYGEWMEYKSGGEDTLLDDLYDDWQKNLKFVLQNKEGE